MESEEEIEAWCAKIDYRDLLEEGLLAAAASYAAQQARSDADSPFWTAWNWASDVADTAVQAVTRAIEQKNESAITALEEEIRRALKVKPMSERPHTLASLRRALGHLMLARGETDKALMQFEAALSFDPKIGCKRLVEELRKTK